MAQDEDRRWRERMQRDDENRPYEAAGNRRGEYRRGDSYSRGYREGSDWRERDFNRQWPAETSQSNWGDRPDSDWEQTSWRDLERERAYGRGGENRRHGNREVTQGAWSAGARDERQDRDYAGSLRSSDRGGQRSYSGSKYGDADQGGRSGMGYGGGRSRGMDSRGREQDQYGRQGAEPGYASAYGASTYRGMERGYGYGGPHDWVGSGPAPGEERGFWDKATDEVSSWFGDDDAERRREMDRQHTGRGPRNYARSDSRINEDVCDRLTDHPMVDASDIEVAVSGREVTLSGTVNTRDEKRRAEDIAEAVSGVTHVQNNLRVQQSGSGVQKTLDSFANATSGAFGERGGSTMSSRSGPSTSASSATPSDTAKTTTGSSPGVMRADPSTAPTKGA